MERCLQAEQCWDGSLVVLSCRDAALDQQPVIFFSENAVLLLNFAHCTPAITAKNAQCCPGKLRNLHSVALQVSTLVARLCSLQLFAHALQTVCLWAVQSTAAFVEHCTAAFAEGPVAVLSERRETNNEEVVQQLSE